MSGFFTKLGLAHRHLWTHEGRYRVAMFLGPLPLVGALSFGGFYLAAGAAGFAPLPQTDTTPKPPWAKPIAGVPTNNTHNPATKEPLTLKPSAALPPASEQSSFERRWTIDIKPLRFSPTMEAYEEPITLTSFVASGPDFTVADFAKAAGAETAVVGNGRAMFVAETAGPYALSFNVESPLGTDAGCLVTLHVRDRKVLGYVIISSATDPHTTTPAAKLNLDRGLYDMSWVFGCWRHGKAVEDGRMMLLVGHPGESGPTVPRAGDFVRSPSPSSH